MVEDSKTKGKTLAEALLAWGDPTAVAEMIELAEEGYDGPAIFSLEGPTTACERKWLRYQSVRERLEQGLIEKLRNGQLFATGYDPRAPFDAPPLILPGDRWRVLTPNFQDSSAADAGVTITGILVHQCDPATAAPANATRSKPEVGGTTRTGPETGRSRLEIDRTTRRVRFDDTDLRLSPRSFDLLLMLAEAAVMSGALVSGRDIEARLWSVRVNKQAVNDAVGKLKSELVKQGMDKAAVGLAIENLRAKGYRLALAPTEIQVVT